MTKHIPIEYLKEILDKLPDPTQSKGDFKSLIEFDGWSGVLVIKNIKGEDGTRYFSMKVKIIDPIPSK